MELHKSETFQFGNVNSKPNPTNANIDDSNGPPKEAVNSLVCGSDHELDKAKEKVPVEEQQKSSSTIR